MALTKCPRCELNYILDDQKYCIVCRREIKGEPERNAMPEMCSVCGENPVQSGKDLCNACLKEQVAVEASTKSSVGEDGAGGIDEADSAATMLMNSTDDELPQPGLASMEERELSLDDVLAEEEEGAEDDDSEDAEDV